ncbi:hypothetical protein QM565_38350 [Geitlerinema splendidum]|nr:hypothetical protein [Geitlerinema splendidum]
MAANVEAMVREGIAAVKDGRKDEGRALAAQGSGTGPLQRGWLALAQRAG